MERATTDADAALDLGRMRDLRGRRSHPWIRRGLLAVLVVPVVAAAAGAVGQPSSTRTSVGTAARLQVEQPDVLRGGLLWRARIAIRAIRAIDYPRVVLGPGFVDGMQVNTIAPDAQSEASRGDHLVLSYDRLDAGDELVVHIQFQVDPTTFGSQDTAVELDDARHVLARVPHSTTLLP
jgi:hypothetical protein